VLVGKFSITIMSRLIHLGCGSRTFPGWENYDMEIDMSRPLPFQDGTVDFLFTNHTLEHLHPHSVYFFCEEVKRVLSPSGVARIQVPSVERVRKIAPNYPEYVTERGGLDIAIRNIILSFGHITPFTESLLESILINVGLEVTVIDNRESTYPQFKNAIDFAFGKEEIIYDVETIAIEARVV
jgi:SAM-dependent methyltransferase